MTAEHHNTIQGGHSYPGYGMMGRRSLCGGRIWEMQWLFRRSPVSNEDKKMSVLEKYNLSVGVLLYGIGNLLKHKPYKRQ